MLNFVTVLIRVMNNLSFFSRYFFRLFSVFVMTYVISCLVDICKSQIESFWFLSWIMLFRKMKIWSLIYCPIVSGSCTT